MNKLLISKSGFDLQEVELVHGSICIGRAKDNDILLNDATVSSHHAKIVTVMSTSYIQDLGSTNGVYVNGKPVVVQALHPNDVIAIGKHELLYRQEELKESSQDENVYDTHVMKSLARAGAAGSHETSAATDKPFTDFRGTINFSDADISEIGQPGHGIRVVVDNTGAKTTVKTAETVSKSSLDIDVDFDKYLDGNSGLDSMPGVYKKPARGNDSESYVVSNPYIDVQPPVDNGLVTRDHADRLFEEGCENKNIEISAQVPETKAEQAAKNESLSQSSNTINEMAETVSTNATSSTSLQSKQPFMSSEEVVEQLIQMGRDKAKRSKKSSSLSSIIGVITFLAILVAVYFQLQ